MQRIKKYGEGKMLARSSRTGWNHSLHEEKQFLSFPWIAYPIGDSNDALHFSQEHNVGTVRRCG